MTHHHELDSKKYYDKIAHNFNHTWDGFLSGFFKRFICKQLTYPAQAKLLDIGCANGTLLSMLNAQKAIEGFGLDISPEMVRVAQQTHPIFSLQLVQLRPCLLRRRFLMC